MLITREGGLKLKFIIRLGKKPHNYIIDIQNKLYDKIILNNKKQVHNGHLRMIEIKRMYIPQ